MTFAFPETVVPGARWCPPAPPCPTRALRPARASRTTLEARVRRYNSDVDPASSRFRAAVLLLAGLEWGHNVDRLARRTGYDRAFVARCARRLIDNGVWHEGRTVADWSADDEASGSFWSDVAVAEGLLCRRVAPGGAVEWAPPGYWNKSYQFVEPGEDPGLSVRYHDAGPAPGRAEPGAAQPADAADPPPGLARDEVPHHIPERPVNPGESGTPSLEDVFTDAVWIR